MFSFNVCGCLAIDVFFTPSTHRTRTVGKPSGDREMAAVVLTFVLFVVGICIAISKIGKLSCDGRNTEEVVTTPRPRGRSFDTLYPNSPPIQPQSLIRDTPLRNSTVPIQLQPSQNNNSNVNRTTTTVQQQTSNLPPAYDSVVEENGVIIIMQQQALLPPAYDAFMQQNNAREGTDL
ncbi:unnamed protein product [Adineta steineri]|uniref:Uncharacterized protein n=1 Tax=Adineta steineri TaxID=433720 RepID=A0A814M3F1_9BILA|nr:unnamed protein product [Adineta steineri]CAF1322706.1 unnamed protein product [Adineta steineri]CAF1325144.1 unnamed protein product [Adineta steineri]